MSAKADRSVGCVTSLSVFLVWGRKAGAWQLPGAHGEADSPQTAILAATKALGRAPQTRNPVLWSLAAQEIPEYWQTPAHRHYELIFRFDEPQTGELPRGAKWFSPAEIAQLGDETLLRLLQKCQL